MKRVTWVVLWAFLSSTFWVNAWPQQLTGPDSYPPSDWSQGSSTPSLPKVSVSPTSVNFGNLTAGKSSEKPVAIKNGGKSDLIISSITVSGNNVSDFSQTSHCSTIAAGSSCTVAVTFAPTSAGKKSGILSIASNDPKKPLVNVKLSGNATCAYSLTSTSQQCDASGGAWSVDVKAPSGCGWTAASKASWITITSGKSGSGNGTVTYAVGVNSSASQRTGTMTIAKQTFTETQSPCPTPGIPSGPSPGNGATGVSTSPTLSWAAVSDADSYDVYAGTTSNPPFMGNTTSTSYRASALSADTDYFWKVVAKNNCGSSTPGPVWSFNTGSSPVYTPSQDQQALLDQYGAPDYLSVVFSSSAPTRQETWVYVSLQKIYLFWDGVSFPATNLTVDPEAYADPPYLDPAMFTKDTTLSDIADYLQSNYTTVDTSVLQPLIGNSDFKAYEFKDAGLYVAYVGGSLTAVQTIDIPKTPQSPAAMPSFSRDQGSSSDPLPAVADPEETALTLFTLGFFIYISNGYDVKEINKDLLEEYHACESSTSSEYHRCRTNAAIAFFFNALLSIPDKSAGLQSVAQQAQTITNDTGTSTEPCTEYTYTRWEPDPCPDIGIQTRFNTGYTPAGCTGFPRDPPVTTQSCTPAKNYTGNFNFTTPTSRGCDLECYGPATYSYSISGTVGMNVTDQPDGTHLGSVTVSGDITYTCVQGGSICYSFHESINGSTTSIQGYTPNFGWDFYVNTVPTSAGIDCNFSGSITDSTASTIKGSLYFWGKLYRTDLTLAAH